MKVTKTSLEGVLIIEPKIFQDERGYFFESYNEKAFRDSIGKNVEFKQDNQSKSSKGVLRGMHYQESPFEQGKLVRCVRGEVYDVVVDIRNESPSFGNWIGEIISAENKKQLWIPAGFAHGFLTLSEEAEFVYKTTNYYSPSHERCIKWNDATLNIDWPKMEYVISEKDQQGMAFHLLKNKAS